MASNTSSNPPQPDHKDTTTLREQIADVIGDIVGDFNSGGNIPDINKVCPNELDTIMQAVEKVCQEIAREPRFKNTQLGWKRLCDYCSEPNPPHTVKLTRTPNGDTVYSELCEQCYSDIAREAYKKGYAAGGVDEIVRHEAARNSVVAELTHQPPEAA